MSSTGMVLTRQPEDDDELWELVATLWGFYIPRTSVCPHHRPPFEAFADAYFARSAVSIWKASRGLGGKSTLLGILALTEACVLGAQVTVLGGSAAQSQRVHEVTKEAWSHPLAPSGLLVDEPTIHQTKIAGNAWIRPLLASSRSVRGPHPQRLRLDEVDEMDLPIFEAAQGQPMEARGVASQTVISSTHQYPDKTMTECLKRAVEKDWTVFEWCYRENMAADGWLLERQVLRKKEEISSRMWAVEFELQEPNFEGRVLSAEFLDQMFDMGRGVHEGEADRELQFDDPKPHHTYVTGIDWAKEHDWTVVTTWDRTQLPWEMVAFYRANKLPWPVMIAKAEKQARIFDAFIKHDATGIGNVVKDLMSFPKTKVVDQILSGRERHNMFTEYITAIEQGNLVAPRIKWMYDEYKYMVHDDLYSTGGHPPDSFISGALSWSLRKQRDRSQVVMPVFEEFARSGSPWQIG